MVVVVVNCKQIVQLYIQQPTAYYSVTKPSEAPSTKKMGMQYIHTHTYLAL